MPSPLSGNYTLRELLNNTYRYKRNRFFYAERDIIKKITVKKIAVYQRTGRPDKAPGEARTLFQIQSFSYPQYKPYRPQNKTNRQMKYRHDYSVFVQLEKLSIDVPFKGRVGSDRKWRFESKIKVQGKGRNRRVIESENIKKGINGDFWFRCSFLWHKEGILYGRNWTNGPPNKVNPKGIIFAPKHFIAVVEKLMNMGILKEGR